MKTAANDKRVKLLETIPGIAPYSVLYLSTMLDDVEKRFQAGSCISWPKFHACTKLAMCSIRPYNK
ncbi:MAG: hypothetical protein RXR51_04835, partial [Nitrososphaeria archaeon]